MSGIAAIQSRIGAIEGRMSELGLPSPRSAGVSFDGIMGNLHAQAAASTGSGTTGAGTQKYFGYVPVGTKLATVPGTQAYATAQAEAAAAAAAAREAAARAAAEQAAARAAEAARPAARSGRSTAAAAVAASGPAASAAATSRPSAAGGSAAVSAPSSSGGLTGQQVVDTAKKYLGVPYKWGGQSRSGMDCSGLVQRTFLDHGIKLPRTARSLMKAGTEVPSLAQAQPGDLIITRGGGHVSIYMGDNKIIHAPYAGEVVKIQKNYSTDRTIDTIRRIV